MIIAICVYDVNKANYTKILYSQQSSGEIFPSNKLQKLEAQSLRQFAQQTEDRLKHYPSDDEHHYLFRPNLNDNILLAMVSKTRLDPVELRYLFTNIEHIRLRPQSVRATLDDIVRNPLGYTGKDILVSAVQDELDETTKILLEAVDKVVLRGEKLQELDTQTLNLRYSAKRFEDEASKLNSCCRF